MNVQPVIEARTGLRRDLRLIADMIEPHSRVLDVGCGDGALLDDLVRARDVDGRGIELSQSGVNACVSRGLSVIQGDADTDLNFYPDDAFDYAVLSNTLHATRDPKGVLLNLVRIGRQAVVSFDNVGHWRLRWRYLMGGRMAVFGEDGTRWYDTPNIHMCTFLDFADLCDQLDLQIDRAVILSHGRPPEAIRRIATKINLTGEAGIFLLSLR